MKGDNMTEFNKNEIVGKQAVDAFKKYLTTKKVTYRDASDIEQKAGIDLVINNKTYEIKHQTLDNCLIIEETSINDNQSGWIYTSKADYLIEVSSDRSMITKISMPELRTFYTAIKNNYKLYPNKCSEGKFMDHWTSWFRIIEVNDLNGYVSVRRTKIK